MTFKPNVWDQLRNKTADDLIAALAKDGWLEDTKLGASRAYLKEQLEITIHYHPQKTYGAKLLKALLNDIGWTDDDLRRLKLIKVTRFGGFFVSRSDYLTIMRSQN